MIVPCVSVPFASTPLDESVLNAVIKDITLNLSLVPQELAAIGSCHAPSGSRVVCLTCGSGARPTICLDCFVSGQHDDHVWFIVQCSDAPCRYRSVDTPPVISQELMMRLKCSTGTLLHHAHATNSTNSIEQLLLFIRRFPIYCNLVAGLCCLRYPNQVIESELPLVQFSQGINVFTNNLADSILHSLEECTYMSSFSTDRLDLLNKYVSRGYSFLEFYIFSMYSCRAPLQARVYKNQSADLHVMYSLISTDEYLFPRAIFKIWPYIFFPVVFSTIDAPVCAAFLNDDVFCASLQAEESLEMYYCTTREPRKEITFLPAVYRVVCKTLKDFDNTDLAQLNFMQSILTKQLILILCRNNPSYTCSFVSYFQKILNASHLFQNPSQSERNTNPLSFHIEILSFIVYEKYIFDSISRSILQLIKAIQTTSVLPLLSNPAFYKLFNLLNPNAVNSALLSVELVKFSINKFAFIRRKVTGEHVSASDLIRQNLIQIIEHDYSMFSTMSRVLFETSALFSLSVTDSPVKEDTVLFLLMNLTLHGCSNLGSYLYNMENKMVNGSSFPAIFLAAIHNIYEYCANYRTFLMSAQDLGLSLDSSFVDRLRQWAALTSDGYSCSGLRLPSLPLYASLLHGALIEHMKASSGNSAWSLARRLREQLVYQDQDRWFSPSSWFVDKLLIQEKIASTDVMKMIHAKANELFPVPEEYWSSLEGPGLKVEKVLSTVFLAILTQIIRVSLVHRMATGSYARNGEEVIKASMVLVGFHRPAYLIAWHRYISTLRLLISMTICTATQGSIGEHLSVSKNPVSCCILAIITSFGLISRGLNDLFMKSSSALNTPYLPLLAIEIDRRRFMFQHVEIISAFTNGELGCKASLHPESSAIFVSLYEGALLFLLQLFFVSHIPYPTEDCAYLKSFIAIYAALNPHSSPSSLVLELSDHFPDTATILSAIAQVCEIQPQEPRALGNVTLTIHGWEVLEPLLAPLELDRVHTAFIDSGASHELHIIPALLGLRCNGELLDYFISSRYTGDLLLFCCDLYASGNLKHCYFLHLLRLLHCLIWRLQISKFLISSAEIADLITKLYAKISANKESLLFDPMASLLVRHIEERLIETNLKFESISQPSHANPCIAPPIKRVKRKPLQVVKQRMTEVLTQLMTEHYISRNASTTGLEPGCLDTNQIECCVCLEPLSSNSLLVCKMQLYALSELDIQLLFKLQAVPLQVVQSNFLHVAFQKYIYQLQGEGSRYPPRIWPELSIFDLNPHKDCSSISHHSTGHLYLPDIPQNSILIPYVEHATGEEHASAIMSFFTVSSMDLFSLFSVSCPHLQHVSCILNRNGSENSTELTSSVCPVCSLQYLTGMPLFQGVLIQPSCFWSAANRKVHSFIMVELMFPLLIRILYIVHSRHDSRRISLNTQALKTVLSSEPFLLGMILFLLHFIDCNLLLLIFLLKCNEVTKGASLLQLFFNTIVDLSRIFCVALYLLRYIQAFDVVLGKKPFVQAVNECLSSLGEKFILSVRIIWKVAVAIDRKVQDMSEQGVRPSITDLTRCLILVVREILKDLMQHNTTHNHLEDAAVPYDFLLSCIEAMVYEAICADEFLSTYVPQLRKNIEKFFHGAPSRALDMNFQLEVHSLQEHITRIMFRNQNGLAKKHFRTITFNLLCPLACAETAFKRVQLAYSILGKNSLFLNSKKGRVCIYCGLPVDDRQEELFLQDKLTDKGFCSCWGNEFFESPFVGCCYVKMDGNQCITEPYEDIFGFINPENVCFTRFSQRHLSAQVLSLIYSGVEKSAK